jgi:hypothetical protein
MPARKHGPSQTQPDYRLGPLSQAAPRSVSPLRGEQIAAGKRCRTGRGLPGVQLVPPRRGGRGKSRIGNSRAASTAYIHWLSGSTFGPPGNDAEPDAACRGSVAHPAGKRRRTERLARWPAAGLGEPHRRTGRSSLCTGSVTWSGRENRRKTPVTGQLG